MSDLSTVTQQAVLKALADPATLEGVLGRLQSALSTIREAYRDGKPPPFHDRRVRAAYALAYFPHHCALSAAAFAAAGPDMLGLRDGAQVLVLGAGPGPEVVGLAQMLALKGQSPRIDWHLVDREPGWCATRATTIDAVLPKIDGFAPDSFRITAHEHDLASEEGLRAVAELLRYADLVVAETLLTELPEAGEGTHLVDVLTEHLAPEARLLIVDLPLVRRLAPARSRIALAKDLQRRLASTLTFPAADALAPLRKHFFSTAEHPRKKLNVSIELFSRPGCTVLPLTRTTAFLPNPGQIRAMEQLRRFLNGTDRVFVLSGPAGSGKTSLFPSIVSLAQDAQLPVVLVAPTGQAARRLARVSSLSASTVHTLIYDYEGELQSAASDEVDADPSVESARDAVVPLESAAQDEQPPVAVFKRRDPADHPAVYIVDEASLVGNRPMLDDSPEVIFAEGTVFSDLLAYALDHPESRLVLVGDVEQLPPVGESVPPALVSSEIFALLGQEPVMASLEQVMRQDEDSGLLGLADRARGASYNTGIETGPCAPEAGVNLLSSDPLPAWVNAAIVKGEGVVVAARNADAARWNLEIRRREGRPVDRPVSGDLVSVLRRDGERALLNGDDLVVEQDQEEVEIVRLRDDTVTLRKARFRWALHGVGSVVFSASYVADLLPQASADEQKRVTQILYVDFKRRHAHLDPNGEAFKLSYANDSRVNALRVGYSFARTCHRAQGGEWPHVVVDFEGSRWLGPDFGRWSYTAVTRAKRTVWLANLPAGAGQLGAQRLAEGAQSAIVKTGLAVSLEDHRPIQNGVQINVVGRNEVLSLNLYEKKGRPSSVSPTGSGRPEFTEDVIEVLRAWIDEESVAALEPLPDKLERVSVLLGARLAEQDFDLDYRAVADYQVAFRARAPSGALAQAVCYYKSDGRLTSVARTEGDLTLQKVLREAIERLSE